MRCPSSNPYILENIPEITRKPRVDPPSESECIEEESGDEIMDEVIDESQSTVLRLRREGDESGDGHWRIARDDEDDEDIQALLDDELIWADA